jgi:hypothetical protein
VREQRAIRTATGSARSPFGRWTEECGNPDCRTGWLQLWRRRSTPRLEGMWGCSTACMELIATVVVKRSIEDWEHGTRRRELLMPLGLVLLSRGWITRDELNAALTAQRRYGEGRIGQWLCRLSALSEATLAKGLAAQWNCTALTAATAGIEKAEALVPSMLLDPYGLVLLRNTMNSRLYLAGSCRAEYAAGRALERMLNVPVEPAFLEDGVWRQHTRNRAAADHGAPPASGAVVEITQAVERGAPRQARVVRIHNHLWLRMFDVRRKRSVQSVEDVVIPLRTQAGVLEMPKNCVADDGPHRA